MSHRTRNEFKRDYQCPNFFFQVEGCFFNMTFLTEGGSFRNAFGYFYWDNATRRVNATAGNLGLIPIFPDTSAAGSQVPLLKL